MVLAIWLAARVQTLHLPWFEGLGLAVAACLATIFRWARGAGIADVSDGPILRAYFLARFTVTPAVFLLGIVTAIAGLLRLDATATLWLATQYALAYGAGAILLTSFALQLALGIRGPRRDSTSVS